MTELTSHINPNPACNVAVGGGILPPFGAFTECRRGNLLLDRRTIAAPHRGVFLFGLCSCVVPLTAATRKPLRRAVSYLAVSNLRGAAYPVERVRGSQNLDRNRIMSTISQAQCVRTQRAQTTLNHLRADARAVRRAVNPYASLERGSSLSSLSLKAAAYRRFSSLSNFSIEA